MGSRPRDGDLADAEPLRAVLPLAWLEHALHRRSRSDLSKSPVGFEAESAAILSSALDRMSRAMVGPLKKGRGAVRSTNAAG